MFTIVPTADRRRIAVDEEVGDFVLKHVSLKPTPKVDVIPEAEGSAPNFHRESLRTLAQVNPYELEIPSEPGLQIRLQEWRQRSA